MDVEDLALILHFVDEPIALAYLLGHRRAQRIGREMDYGYNPDFYDYESGDDDDHVTDEEEPMEDSDASTVVISSSDEESEDEDAEASLDEPEAEIVNNANPAAILIGNNEHVEQEQNLESSDDVRRLYADAINVSLAAATVSSSTMSASCQTTPSLSRHAKAPDGTIDDAGKSGTACKGANDSMEEDQGCPICFEPWSNSGLHRLASLTCGHLFGRSCIERWLKSKNVDKCPQCNLPAKRKDIRNIYAKSVRVIDTAERDTALKELDDERTKRSSAEQEKARAILQYELAKAEIQMLKQQLQDKDKVYQESSTSSSRIGRVSAPNDDTGKRKFVLQKTLQIAQSNARVMAYDYCRGVLTVSKPSPNQLFPGFGVVKISSLESRTSEYVNIHQKPIRDATFSGQGDLLLSGSIDKMLKVTSMSCNSVVQSYSCPAAVWSCAWNTEDANYIYAGLQNGSCFLFDTRNTSCHVKDLKMSTQVASCCPVVSLSYVPPQSCSSFSPHGLLVGTLNGGYFLENTEADYLPYVLPFPEGSCTCLSFDEVSRHCMLSQRPNKAFPRTRHMIYELTGSGIGGRLVASDERASSSRDTTVCSCRVVTQCVGTNMNKLLSRSSLFSYPDEPSRLFACAGDESTCSAIVWNARSGIVQQKIPSPGPDQVIDALAFTANNDNFLSVITERKLAIHKWT